MRENDASAVRLPCRRRSPAYILATVMRGFVTTRHLLMHSPTILHEFGARCYLRCVWRALTTRRPVTFLECMPPLDVTIETKR